MPHSGNDVIDQLLIPAVLWLFVLVAVAGIAVGIGLLVRGADTLRFLRGLNRWTSFRNQLKPLEEMHDISKTVYGRRRWIGGALIAGGAYVVFMLAVQIQFASVIAILSRDRSPVVVELLVESLRWFLVAGGVAAMVFGAMLAFSSESFRRLEARVNTWYSPRQLGKGADEMHLTLDQWAEAFPRTAGAMLIAGSIMLLLAWLAVGLGV
jgi:hypothetical protein